MTSDRDASSPRPPPPPPGRPGASLYGSARLVKPASGSGSNAGPLPAPGSRPGSGSGSGRLPAGRLSPAPLDRPASGIGRRSSGALPAAVAEAAADPRRRIGERYVVVDEIGRGGMGVVYRAYDTALRRPVAIKMITEAAAAAPERRERFRREAEAAARLRHAAIVGVHEAGEHEGKPYLVMAYVEGEDLESRLRREPLPPRRAADLLREIALALDHAHAHGVVHRDVKPENILVDAEDHAHLTDFGLARELTSSSLTATGQVVGTPAYLAPEQADNSGDRQGPRTDVYALGGVLYRALAGRPPFDGETMFELLRKVLTVEPVPLRARRPDVHPDLETIAARCLEKEPERRYPGAAELAEDLRRFVAGEPILARPTTRGERIARWVRRNRVLSFALALLLALLGGSAIAAGIVIRTRRLEALAQERAVREAERDAVEAERARVVEAARAAALEACDAFAERRAASGRAGAGGALAAERFDALLASGLDALDATEQLRALAPEDEQARRVTFSVAMALGETALAAEQWSVAASAYERAARLEVDRARAAEAVASVERGRNRRLDEHRAAIEALIARAQETDVLVHRETYADALLRLVGWREPQTAEILARTLHDLAEAHEQTAASLLAAAERPTLQEARAGGERLAGLREAIAAAREAPPGAELDGRTARVLREAEERLERRVARAFAGYLRARGGGAGAGEPAKTGGAGGEREAEEADAREADARREISFRWIAATAQREAEGERRLLLARLCCEALGRLGFEQTAIPALTAYVHAEADEMRALPAAVALCRLGGPEAIAAVFAARARFGENGPFWSLVREAMRGLAVELPLSGETAAAYRARGDVRFARGELDGAVADYTRALELAPEDARTYCARARARIEQGELELAITDAYKAIEKAPEQAAGWNVRGRAKLARGEGDDPMFDLSKAIELEPENARYWYDRGLARAADKAWSRAIDDLTEAIEREPLYATAWAERGRCYFERGIFDRAREDLGRAIYLDSGQGRALAQLAALHATEGEDDLAMETVERALALSPDSAFAWLIKSRCHQNRGDFDGAREAAERAIELASEETNRDEKALGYNCKGLALYSQGKLREAVAAFDESIRLDPKMFLTYANRGLAHISLGQIAAAVADCDEAIELSPDFPMGYANRAMARQAAGDAKGAIADYDAAIERSPGMAVFWNGRGLCRYNMRQWKRAIADFSKALELDPRLPIAWSNRGLVHYQMGNHDAAIADLTRALGLDPSMVIAYSNRALARQKKGDDEGAVEDLSRALELDPRNPLLWNNRGSARKDAGDLEGSLADLNRGLEIAPRYPLLYKNRAYTRRKMGDPAGAIADFQKFIELAPKDPSVPQVKKNIAQERAKLKKKQKDAPRAKE